MPRFWRPVPAVKVLITGSRGFLGWHLRCRLSTMEDAEVVEAPREVGGDIGELTSRLRGCDVVVHLAGVNRGSDEELSSGNDLAGETLVCALSEAGDPGPFVVYSSSTHVERDPPTVYGSAKARTAAMLRAWSERSGRGFAELIIPHVFGEHGRPHYNSVVATFCHQLSAGERPVVVNDAALELVHAQTVVDWIVRVASSSDAGTHRLTGREISVAEVLALLTRQWSSYESGVVPCLSSPFEARLFNTLRSYLFPESYPMFVSCHMDPRGSLFEVARVESGGQCFLSTTKPGVTRGNHFHRRKFERFAVIHGSAVVRVRRVLESEVHEFPLDGDHPAFVDIPTLHTHNITNVGSNELTTLFWSNEFFDPDDADTYALEV